MKDLQLWGHLANSKFIPTIYMSASAADRRLLLAGLMDTDGWARGSQFSTVSEKLALDVVHLVRSLGGIARLSKKKTAYMYRGERRSGQDSYMVTMKLSFTPFMLERKKAVYERRPRTAPCRKVVSVEDIGTAECVCISVDAPDHLYVTRDYVVTHNTFIMIRSVIERKQRTLVLVHKDKLADQFISRFRDGSPPAREGDDFTPITNCKDVEEALGRKIIGRFNGEKIWPVTVATWQSFTSKPGQKRLSELSRSFGYVLVDEAHNFAARFPAKVVSKIQAKVRQGATATPERQDMMEVGLYDVLGPMTGHGIAPQLPVTAYMIATGCERGSPKIVPKNEWSRILNWCCAQDERNDLICEWLKEDVAAGRKILVLGERRNWCLDMAERMCKEYGLRATASLGGLKSKREKKAAEQVITDMNEGRVDIIFATSVFKEGVDVPVLDTLYYATPGKNPHQLKQSLGRIRRPYEGKLPPMFRYFVDSGGRLSGCARATQRALREWGMQIVMVPEGRKPANVMKPGAFGNDDTGQPKKTGLRAAAGKQSSALNALFNDVEEDNRTARKYKNRLGGRR